MSAKALLALPGNRCHQAVKPIFMAVPKPFLIEFGIRHRLESGINIWHLAHCSYKKNLHIMLWLVFLVFRQGSRLPNKARYDGSKRTGLQTSSQGPQQMRSGQKKCKLTRMYPLPTKEWWKTSNTNFKLYLFSQFYSNIL